MSTIAAAAAAATAVVAVALRLATLLGATLLVASVLLATVLLVTLLLATLLLAALLLATVLLATLLLATLLLATLLLALVLPARVGLVALQFACRSVRSWLVGRRLGALRHRFAVAATAATTATPATSPAAAALALRLVTVLGRRVVARLPFAVRMRVGGGCKGVGFGVVVTMRRRRVGVARKARLGVRRVVRAGFGVDGLPVRRRRVARREAFVAVAAAAAAAAATTATAASALGSVVGGARIAHGAGVRRRGRGVDGDVDVALVFGVDRHDHVGVVRERRVPFGGARRRGAQRRRRVVVLAQIVGVTAERRGSGVGRVGVIGTAAPAAAAAPAASAAAAFAGLFPRIARRGVVGHGVGRERRLRVGPILVVGRSIVADGLRRRRIGIVADGFRRRRGRFVVVIAVIPVIAVAVSRHESRSWSSGTTRETSPIVAASAAVTSRPVSMISAARDEPIARGSR